MMQYSEIDITKITQRFNSNVQAINRVKKSISIIEEENRELIKLLSEIKPDPDSLLAIKTRRAINKRNSQIKHIQL